MNKEIDCRCMLCSDRETSVKTNEAREVFAKPTKNCPYLPYWDDMNRPCCCTMHEFCDNLSLQHCTCPKCCPCILTVVPCDTCKSKATNYYPCYHMAGICKTYLRTIFKSSNNEEPMEID